MGKCERCGASPEGDFGMHDYCAKCGMNLCKNCMAKGHCGETPAKSGMAEDDEGEENNGHRTDTTANAD